MLWCSKMGSSKDLFIRSGDNPLFCWLQGSTFTGSSFEKKTSFLPSQRATLRSSASISGRSNGFNFLFSGKMTGGRKAGCTVIKCEAAVAEKETPAEKHEYQAEVNLRSHQFNVLFLQDGFSFESLEQYFDLQHKMCGKYCNNKSLHFVIMLQYVDFDCKLNTCGYEDATKGPREDLESEQSCAFAILKRIFGCLVHYWSIHSPP